MPILARISNNKGTALTEFAIAIPLFFTMIFSLLDYTVLINEKIELSDITKSATRSVALLGDIESTYDYAEQVKHDLIGAMNPKYSIAAEQILVGQKIANTSDVKVEIYCQKALTNDDMDWTDCSYLTIRTNYQLKCDSCKVLSFFPESLYTHKDQISIRLENEL